MRQLQNEILSDNRTSTKTGKDCLQVHAGHFHFHYGKEYVIDMGVTRKSRISNLPILTGGFDPLFGPFSSDRWVEAINQPLNPQGTKGSRSRQS